MSKYSYLATPDDLLKTFTSNHLLNMEGYIAAWESKPEVLQRLLPPPLELASPVVQIYVCNILNPTLMPWYREASMTLRAKHGDRHALWTMSLLLDGPGAEMGGYLGREKLNMPKKLVEAFEISRFDNVGKARIARHGEDLLQLTADINGKYNTPAGEAHFADYKVGNKVPFNSFFYLYNAGMVDGKPGFVNGRIVELDIQVDIKRWDVGTFDITLGETPDDPWAEMEIVKPLGGAYTLFDMYLNHVTPICEADAMEGALRTLKHRFDASTYGGFSQIR